MKKSRKFLVSMFLLVFCVVCMSGTALAANPTSVKLSAGKTYKSYDITGDKKADTILISKKKIYYQGWDTGAYQSVSITVNGKKVYSLNKTYFYLSVKLYTLANGKPYLHIDATSDDYGVAVSGLFRYKNGKLAKEVDFHNTALKCGVGQVGTVQAVNGNTFAVDYFFESYALSNVKVRYNYKYVNGALKKTSAIGTFKKISFKSAPRSLTTKTKLTAYKSTTSDKKAFTIPAGKSVKIDRCYCGKNYMRFRVKYSGKYGWVKAATSGYEIINYGMFSRQFKNIQLGL